MATTTNSAAVRQLSDQNSQGTVLGASSTDLIGFYGVATPVVRPALTGSMSSGAAAQSLVNALHNLGLVSSTGTSA